jgi:hypothetical protein
MAENNKFSLAYIILIVYAALCFTGIKSCIIESSINLQILNKIVDENKSSFLDNFFT